MTPKRRCRPWDEAEIELVLDLVSRGWVYRDIADQIERTENSVRVMVHKQRQKNRRRRRAQKNRRSRSFCTKPLGSRDSCDPLTSWVVTSGDGIGGHHVW